ncbi:signal peptidase I [Shewanella sp. SHSM-M6]|uniref:Signal peptidase I n=2 Tax=Shewanella salipaludis TaxID=2723052 RepID=A0A972G2P2_9GAMM|nr:signal peptidase I [Shewanella salipaludis]
MMQRVGRGLRDNKGFLLFVGLMCVFRSAVADWNTVPTGSMLPTIVPGDRILVDRLAYDLRLPFTHVSLARLEDPARGDIVVFDSKAADKRLVKRVVGVPGDSVAMNNNRLTINGMALDYGELDGTVSASAAATVAGAESPSYVDKRESLLGAAHAIRLMQRSSGLANFGPVSIPAGYYLALGDNRDKSADSRVIGLVPRDEILGRANRVLLSLDYEDYYLPRADRFMRSLQP